MRLQATENYPGELSSPGAAERVDRAIAELREQLALAMVHSEAALLKGSKDHQKHEDHPHDGEILALSDLADLMARRYETHLPALLKSITAAAGRES